MRIWYFYRDINLGFSYGVNEDLSDEELSDYLVVIMYWILIV